MILDFSSYSGPVMWLSFADPNLPVGHQFLGVAIVPGSEIVRAATLAHVLGINPGGQVQGQGPFPSDRLGPGDWIGRLLSRKDANALNDQMEQMAEARADD